MRNDTRRKQALLERQVSDCIKGSTMTLDVLVTLTGIHRAKLGRMRQCRAPVTCDEAEKVFLAVRQPGLAMITLACIGEDRPHTPETMAFLNNFMTIMPSFLDSLNDLGTSLNPKWAQGSVHRLAAMMSEQASRWMEAENFAPVPPIRRAN